MHSSDARSRSIEDSIVSGLQTRLFIASTCESSGWYSSQNAELSSITGFSGTSSILAELLPFLSPPCSVGKQVVDVPSFLVRVDSQKHIDFALTSPFGGGRPGRVKRKHAA